MAGQSFGGAINDSLGFKFSSAVADCDKLKGQTFGEIKDQLIKATDLSNYPQYNSKYTKDDNSMFSCIATSNIIQSVIKYNKAIDCIYSDELKKYHDCKTAAIGSWNTLRNTIGDCDCSFWHGSQQENACGSAELKCATGHTWHSGFFHTHCHCDCKRNYNLSPLCKPSSGLGYNKEYVIAKCGIEPQKLTKIPIPDYIDCQSCSNVANINKVNNSDFLNIKQTNDCVSNAVVKNISNNQDDLIKFNNALKDRNAALIARKAKETLRENEEKQREANEKKVIAQYNMDKQKYDNEVASSLKLLKLAAPTTWGVSYFIFSCCCVIIILYSFLSDSDNSNANSDLFSNDDKIISSL